MNLENRSRRTGVMELDLFQPEVRRETDARGSRSVQEQATGSRNGRLSPPPAIETRLDASEAIQRLDRLAVKGRLPGFARYPDSNRFEVALFGEPFDRALVGEIHDHGGQNRAVEFSVRLKSRAPAIFIIAIVFTIWPGVVLTDSLIPGAWGWWPTWWWYLPLVIAPLPFIVPKMWKKSEASARDHLCEQYQRIREALEAEPVAEAA